MNGESNALSDHAIRFDSIKLEQVDAPALLLEATKVQSASSAMAPPHASPRLSCGYRHAALLLATLLLLAPPGRTNAASRVVIAPMRGSNDRVEVFKLSENLWFAGTAQLPPFEGAASQNGSDGEGGGNNENRSERKLQDAAASAPAPAVDPMSGGFNNTYDKFGQTRRRGNTTVGSGLIVAASTTDDPTQEWNFFFIPGSYARHLFVLSLFSHLFSSSLTVFHCASLDLPILTASQPFSLIFSLLLATSFIHLFPSTCHFFHSSVSLHMPLPATAAPLQTVGTPSSVLLSLLPNFPSSLVLQLPSFPSLCSPLSFPPLFLPSSTLSPLLSSFSSPPLPPPSQQRWHQLQSRLEGASALQHVSPHHSFVGDGMSAGGECAGVGDGMSVGSECAGMCDGMVWVVMASPDPPTPFVFPSYCHLPHHPSSLVPFSHGPFIDRGGLHTCNALLPFSPSPLLPFSPSLLFAFAPPSVDYPQIGTDAYGMYV
ncbi:unnamed protein product [Closterium sp. NIES-54]